MNNIRRGVVDIKALPTGSLVLASGKGVVSRMIKRLTRSPWSHVGIIIQPKDVLAGLNMPDEPLIFESTTMNPLQDLLLHRQHEGVQITRFAERLNTYDGHIGVRLMLPGHLDSYEFAILRQSFEEFHGLPYERDQLELLGSAIEILEEGHRDLSSLFCSELIAELFMRAGALDDDPPSNCYVPGDFADPDLFHWSRDVFLLK